MSSQVSTQVAKSPLDVCREWAARDKIYYMMLLCLLSCEYHDVDICWDIMLYS